MYRFGSKTYLLTKQRPLIRMGNWQLHARVKRTYKLAVSDRTFTCAFGDSVTLLRVFW
jgi:hypothetical protein